MNWKCLVEMMRIAQQKIYVSVAGIWFKISICRFNSDSFDCCEAIIELRKFIWMFWLGIIKVRRIFYHFFCRLDSELLEKFNKNICGLNNTSEQLQQIYSIHLNA